MDPRSALLDHVALTPASDIPAEAWAAARVFILDTVGVGLAGSTAAGADELVASAQSWGEGAIPILGRAGTYPQSTAGLLNGFFIHNLEWDAVHEPAVVHAMSVITAACLSEAAKSPAIRGQDFAAAIILGVDIASGLGVAADSGLRFFRPANAGTIGAALAVARLRGLPRAHFDDVLGLAYSQVSGTMQAHVEGSITLPLQVAIGSRSAITAVDMAEAGLSGPHDVLDGPFGYFKIVEDGGSAAAVAERLGSQWAVTQLSHKPYPSGRASPATLEYVLRQSREHDLRLEDVAKIDGAVTPLIHRLVARPYKPGMTPAYARLCLPYLCALALRDGVISPDAPSDENLSDPMLADFAGRVDIKVNTITDPNAMVPQACAITLKNGEVLQGDMPHIYGAPDFPMREAAYLEKFRFAASFSHRNLSAETIGTLETALLDIDTQDSAATIFTVLGA